MFVGKKTLELVAIADAGIAIDAGIVPVAAPGVGSLAVVARVECHLNRAALPTGHEDILHRI